MLYVVVFTSLVAVTASAAGGASWGYGETVAGSVYGPSDWDKVAPQCADKAQSPININTRMLSKPGPGRGLSIKFENSYGLVAGTFSNNGHGPTVKVDKSQGSATLTGGPVGDSVFKLEQFHFHFGCDDDEGSEHTVNGKSFPCEVHFVFYNTKYESFGVAADKSDGLTVVGVFFRDEKLELEKSWPWRTEEFRGFANPILTELELSRSGSRVLERLTRKMRPITEEGKSTVIEKKDGVYLQSLIPVGGSGAQYITYKGSLTTPPCYQSVRWIVLTRTLPIHFWQLWAFRTLKATHGYEDGKMCNNFRPTQPLNGRKVYLVR